MSTIDAQLNGNISSQGLTREEAKTRLRQYEPNAVREAEPHLLLVLAQKFWAPVPWMLEATIILELILGKRPEARWRLRPDDLQQLVALQTRLLRRAIDCVRRGGVLVYSTCSIEPEENRQVVEAVLREAPELRLEAVEDAVPGRPADGGFWAHLRRN